MSADGQELVDWLTKAVAHSCSVEGCTMQAVRRVGECGPNDAEYAMFDLCLRHFGMWHSATKALERYWKAI